MDFSSDDSQLDPDYIPVGTPHENGNDSGLYMHPDFKNIDSTTTSTPTQYQFRSHNLETLNALESTSSFVTSETRMNETPGDESQSQDSSLLSGKYFKIIEKLTDTEFHRKRTGVLAECVICKSKLKGSLQITSNFVKHLKRKHEFDFNEYMEMKAKKVTDANINLRNKQKNFDYIVVRFIVENMLPISVVESQSFINLANYSSSDFKVMTRQTAMKRINEQFDCMIERMKTFISKEKYFCTTADIWSTKHRSFFGYTCHWLEGCDFNRKSVTLACKRFRGAHTYDRINDFIYEINQKFGLNSNNIVATVTDNGSNFVKAFQQFGIEHFKTTDNNEIDDDDDESEYDDLEVPNFDNDIFENALPKHIRCASHTLSLICTSDFMRILKENSINHSRHINVLAKCSNVWSKINRPKTAEQIVDILGTQLKYPVATRWNSLYDSICCLLSKKDKLGELCNALSICKLSDSDFEYLYEYSTILRPLAEGIDFFQKEKYMFYGYLLPTLATLKTKLRKAYLSPNIRILKNEAQALEKSLMKRFSDYFNLSLEVNDAIVATVLHPAIKLNWLNALNTFDEKTIVNIGSIVTEYIERESGTESASGNSNKNLAIDSFFDFSMEGDKQMVSGSAMMPSTAKEQYSLYLADPCRNLEMLNRYPLIKAAFLKSNTPLTSSAAVERLFSFAGLINAPRRGALSDNNFEKMVLLKVNGELGKP